MYAPPEARQSALDLKWPADAHIELIWQPPQKSSEQEEEGEEEMPIVPPLFDSADGPSGLVQSMESVSLGAMKTHHSDAGGGRGLLQSQSHAPLGPIASARKARHSPAVIIEKLQQSLGANALQMEVAQQMTLELLVSERVCLSLSVHVRLPC